MPLQIIHKDITKVQCDVIVDPTNKYLHGSGRADYAIHMAAGEELDEACSQLEPISIGDVAVTPGFKLPCRYILHTRGPIWYGGDRNETPMLRSCYINCLFKARKLGLSSIAFPLISSGAHGFPKDKVLRIAIDAISDYLFTAEAEMDVTICIIDRSSFELSKDIALQEYINRSRNFVYEDHALKMKRFPGKTQTRDLEYDRPMMWFSEEAEEEDDDEKNGSQVCVATSPVCAQAPKSAKGENLSSWIKKQDETFAVLLLKLIDEKGMGEVECYKKANVSKNTFWKINNDARYKPSKPTVIAFAISLELTLEETEALLRSAGFALSRNNCFDMIIEFYITNGIYDIFEINSALYKYDQVCLGC